MEQEQALENFGIAIVNYTVVSNSTQTDTSLEITEPTSEGKKNNIAKVTKEKK